LLLENPDLLLLDEPTNHLDLSTTEWLENFLASWAGGLIIVSHDRYFLDRTTRRTVEMVDGRLEAYPAPYSRYVELRAERYARQNKEYRAQQEEIAKTEEFIRRFKAGQRSKEARGRETRLARVQRLHKAPEAEDLKLQLETSSATGQIILTTLRLRIGFPGHATPGQERTEGRQLLHVPNMQLERGAKIALIGPNGSGKSTLLRTLVGEIKPLAGTYQWGVNVDVGYYAQAHEGLNLNHTVLEELQGERTMSEEEARSYLGRFLFSGDDVFKKVGALSGGERSRVALARLTLQRANVLLLDEPTNHLDIGARQAMESVLRAYPGSLIFVSHDRYFINALANQVWAVEDGIIRLYRGTYTDYLEKRDEGLYQPETPEPAAPRRDGARRQAVGAPAVAMAARPELPLPARPARGVRGAVDERLLPFLERLDVLEREERSLARQITSPAGVDLARLLELSEAYAGVQEGIAAQDEALIGALRSMLAAPVE
jgi:ATP-binding cassette subfamily F protein 3